MSADLLTANSLTLYRATGFWQRLRGLLYRKALTSQEALQIQPCKDVHSFGMKYPIDVVFLNAQDEVLEVKALVPNRWAMCKGAVSVIEFRLGCAARFGYRTGAKQTDRSGFLQTVKSIGERV